MKLDLQIVLRFINTFSIILILHFLIKVLTPYAYGVEHHSEKTAPSTIEQRSALDLIDELEQQILDLQTELEAMQVMEKDSSNEGLSTHKPIYILPLTLSSPVENRLQEEVQFGFSIKQRVIGFSGFKIYAAYSQKSFFQFYDGINSRPFRETNHNPELFIRTPEYKSKNWGSWQLDTGYEHESNGQRVPVSRSWDRLYIHFRIKLKELTLKYKTWYRLPEDKKEQPTDSVGDDNPDIEDFYGRQEARLEWDWNQYTLSMMGRYSIDTEKGGGEINIIFPLLGKTRGLIQYWSGYGESLIDYNRSLTKIGIGFSFHQ